MPGLNWAGPVALMASAAILWAAYGQDAPARPDPGLTPGVIASTSTAEICAPGYARSHRVWRWKSQTLRKYGLPETAGSGYEDDDLVPVCLGGDNSDPRNHWPQPWPLAREKDRLEAKMCRQVCAGEMRLDDAQQYFLSWSRR